MKKVMIMVVAMVMVMGTLVGCGKASTETTKNEVHENVNTNEISTESDETNVSDNEVVTETFYFTISEENPTIVYDYGTLNSIENADGTITQLADLVGHKIEIIVTKTPTGGQTKDGTPTYFNSYECNDLGIVE